MISENTTQIRGHLISEFGFDLLESPRFIEAWLCEKCNLTQTSEYQKTYDATHVNGAKVEIKSSKRTFRNHKRNPFYAYVFSSLQGVTNQGKGAHLFVLVGINNGDLRFWIVPSQAIGKRGRVEIQVTNIKYEGAGKWQKYEVDSDSLIERIDQVAKECLAT